jgi:multicomponent Na+:H+ antiporter subunit D
MSDLLLHPVLPMVLGALLVRVAPQRVGNVVVVAAPLAALASVIAVGTDTSVTMGFLAWDLEVLRADALARPFGVIFASVAAIAAVYGLATQRGPERTAALLYAGAAIGVVYAGDLLTFFVFWEVKAVASTFVILARRNQRAGRAGLRYLFVHIAGGKLLLAGILVHLHQTGSLAFDTIEPGVAATLILIAFVLSAGMPPLHAWLKDAYPEATVAGTVFLSAFTTKSAVYALTRGFPGTEALIYLGVFMAMYGVIYAILANDVRRLLSYHIISQVGFMVTAVGIGTTAAINGAVAHAFAHILYKGLLLMGVGAVLYATGRSKANVLGGLANRMKATLTLYMIGAASISSVPLLSGFVSKELIVDAAYQSDLAVVVILLKIVSVGTFLSTGLKLPYATWFGPGGPGPETSEGATIRVAPIPVTMFVAMGVTAGLNLLLGLAPDLLYSLMPEAVTYTPYTVAKVLEKVLILTFTGLGFWLLLGMLPSKAYVTLDTDWFYRRLPGLVSRRPAVAPPAVTAARPADSGVPASAVGTSPTPERRWQDAAGAAVDGVSTRPRQLLTRVFTPDDGPPGVPATAMLGVVLLFASLVLLTSSLLW